MHLDQRAAFLQSPLLGILASHLVDALLQRPDPIADKVREDAGALARAALLSDVRAAVEASAAAADVRAAADESPAAADMRVAGAAAVGVSATEDEGAATIEVRGVVAASVTLDCDWHFPMSIKRIMMMMCV